PNHEIAVGDDTVHPDGCAKRRSADPHRIPATIVDRDTARRDRLRADLAAERRNRGRTVSAGGNNDLDATNVDPSLCELSQEMRNQPACRSRPIQIIDDDDRASLTPGELAQGSLSARRLESLGDLDIAQNRGTARRKHLNAPRGGN